MATKKVEPRTLKGFRDYLPGTMVPRQAMLRAIEAVFEAWGFVTLATPALEYSEILLGKYGDEGDKLLYRFRDNGDRDVALRYDLTVPLARLVAQHRNELNLPLRRYQVAPVWRAENPQKGRFREFVQCDADIAGATGVVADAEILAVGAAILEAVGVSGYRVLLNHREVLYGVLRASGVTEEGEIRALLREVDKADKLGLGGVLNGLAAAGLGEHRHRSAVDRLLTANEIPDLCDGRLDWLRSAMADDEGRAAVAYLGEVLAALDALGMAGRVVIDPTIARGLDYYTGVIYETRLTDPKVANFGSVMSGGRYDGLVGIFGSQPVPAVGISLGVDRLLDALLELGTLGRGSERVTILVTIFGNETRAASLGLAATLRRDLPAALAAIGLPGRAAVEVATEGGLKKQMQGANRRGADLALVIGPDELAAMRFTLKDLRCGVQEGHDFAAAVEVLAEAVQKRLCDPSAEKRHPS